MSRVWRWVLPGVVLLALAGGITLGDTIVAHQVSEQSAYSITIVPVPGLSLSSVALSLVPDPAPAAPAAPSILQPGANPFCLSSQCTPGDPSESVELLFGTGLNGTVNITLVVLASSGGGAGTGSFGNPGSTAGTIVLVWDLGAPEGQSVSGVQILCNG